MRVLNSLGASQALYVRATAEELPAQISEPVASEALPTIEAVDSTRNMEEWLSRREQSHPSIQPGAHSLIEYERLEHCPDDQRSLGTLHELGGGALKEGWMEREGGKFSKKFEKRWLIAWPADWKQMGQTGPRLFIFEDKSSFKPSKVVELASVEISDPVHPRPAQPNAFRIKGAQGGEVLLWSDAPADVASWRSFFEACRAGKMVKMVQHFRLPLQTLIEQQQGRLQAEIAEGPADSGDAAALDCRVPLILLDCLFQLRKLGATSCEGVFRIPGDAIEIESLKATYESGEITVFGTGESGAGGNGVSQQSYDITTWASFVKLWLRELAEPLIPTEGVYDKAMAIAADNLAHARSAPRSTGIPVPSAAHGHDLDPWVAAAAAPVNELLMSLPLANRRVLLHVVELLREIDPQSTKMTPDNLAICFSPCFFRCADMMEVRVRSLLLTWFVD
jgi:hypothetical protein